MVVIGVFPKEEGHFIKFRVLLIMIVFKIVSLFSMLIKQSQFIRLNFTELMFRVFMVCYSTITIFKAGKFLKHYPFFGQLGF